MSFKGNEDITTNHGKVSSVMLLMYVTGLFLCAFAVHIGALFSVEIQRLLLSPGLERFLYWLAYLLLLAVSVYLVKDSKRMLNTAAVVAQKNSDNYQAVSLKYQQLNKAHNELLNYMKTSHVELELARQHACECSQNKSEFLANVSHELRTPLNAILGYTDILLEQSTAQQQRYLGNIHQGGMQLLELINDLLDLTRLEAGMYELENKPVQISRLLNDVCELLLPLINKAGLELVPVIHDSVNVEVNMDAKRLQEIITNLLINAINYTPQGHISIRCRLAQVRQDHQLFIEIADTGLGMTEEQIQQVSEPFVRHHVKDTGHEGTGLGMAICKQLIQLLNAEMTITSRVKQGTIISLTIPVEIISKHAIHSVFIPGTTYLYHSQPMFLESLQTTFTPVSESLVVLSSLDDPAFEQAGATDRLICELTDYTEQYFASPPDCDIKFITTNRQTNTATPGLMYFPVLNSTLVDNFSSAGQQAVAEPLYCYQENINFPRPVLIVDDRPENLELVAAYLQRLGVDYMSSTSGISALDIYREHHFALVLMDIRMPVLDGIETCQLMRQIRDRQCLFIALTASAIDTEKAHILKAGFDGCICKPISLDELKQCLIEACSTLNIPPGNSGLDWQHSLSICSGDSTLAQQMLSNLLTEIPAMLNSLKVNDSRLLDIEDVHQWAGITSYTGAIHLKELMLELEQLLCRGNYSEANHQLSLLQQELSIVMAQGLQLVRHDNKSNALNWSG